MSINFMNQGNYCLIAISLESSIASIPLVKIYHYKIKKVRNLKHIHLHPQNQITQLAFSKNENILFTFSYDIHLKKGIFSIWNLSEEDLKMTFTINHDIDNLETYYLSQKAVCFIHENKIKILFYKMKKNLVKIKYANFLPFICKISDDLKNNDIVTLESKLSVQNSLIEVSCSDVNEKTPNIENDTNIQDIEELKNTEEMDDFKDRGILKVYSKVPSDKENINKSFRDNFENDTHSKENLDLKFYYYDTKTEFIFLGYKNEVHFYLKNNLIQKIYIKNFQKQQKSFSDLDSAEISAIVSLNHLLLVGLTEVPVILVYSFNPQTNFTTFNEIYFSVKFIFKRVLNFSVSYDRSLIGLSILQSQVNNVDPENIEGINETVELAYIETSILEAVKYSPESFKFINNMGTPAKRIISLALCQNKDILGILSEDRMIKIIDYSNEEKEISSTYLMRKGLALDIHPTGNQCCVGFNDGMKVFFLSEGEFKECFEDFNKLCLCIKYSERGDMLATTSSNSLIIYDPFNFEKIVTLQAHAAPIKFLIWRGLDSVLITSCNNGNIYCWDVRTWEKRFEYFLNDKNKKILALDYDAEFDLLVFSTDDKKMNLIHDKGNITIFSYDLKPNSITSLLIDKEFKIVLAGTNKGNCMMFLWPLQLYLGKLEYLLTPFHSNSITQMAITNDKNYLITGSEDSTIYFSHIRYFNEELSKKKNVGDEDENLNYENSDDQEEDLDIMNLEDDSDSMKKKIQENILKIKDFGLISNEQLNKMKDNIKDCDFYIQNIKNEIEDQQENLKKNHNTQKIQLENDKKNIIKFQKQNLANLLNEEKIKHNEFINNKNLKEENFKNQVTELEELHEKKLINLYQENDDINNNFIKLTENLNGQAMELEKEHTKELYNLENIYYNRISKTKGEYEKALEQLGKDQIKFNETIHQLEEEYNKELRLKKNELEGELIREQKKGVDMKSLNTKLLKESEKNVEKKLRLEDLIEDATKQNGILVNELVLLQEKSKSMQKQLLLQEKTINEKEVFLKKHRTQNNYLQNNKKVYDSLVKSLEKEHNNLLNYFNDISVKLKIVHGRLIEEAESNKTLIVQKNHLFDMIKNNKEVLSKKELEFELTKKRIDNLLNDIYKIMEDYSFKPGELKQELIRVISQKDFVPNFKHLLKNHLETENLTTPNLQLPFLGDKNIGTSKENMEIVNPEEKTPDENVPFKEELLRLRNVYHNKLEQTRNTYKKLTKERTVNFDKIQEKGKNLINKCTHLKNNRIQLYQKLYEAKNCVDNIVKEFNLHKVVSRSKKNRSFLKIKQTSNKEDNALPFSKYIKEKENNKKKTDSQDFNENKLPLNSTNILKKAFTIVKKNKNK